MKCIITEIRVIDCNENKTIVNGLNHAVEDIEAYRKMLHEQYHCERVLFVYKQSLKK